MPYDLLLILPIDEVSNVKPGLHMVVQGKISVQQEKKLRACPGDCRYLETSTPELKLNLNLWHLIVLNLSTLQCGGQE